MNKKENKKALEGVIFLTFGILVLSVLSLSLGVFADGNQGSTDSGIGLHTLNVSTNNLTLSQNSNKTFLNGSVLKNNSEKRIVEREREIERQKSELVISRLKKGLNNSYKAREDGQIKRGLGEDLLLGKKRELFRERPQFLFGDFFRGEGFVTSGEEGNLIRLNLIFTKGNTFNGTVKNFIGTLGIVREDVTTTYKIKGTLDRNTNILEFHTLKTGFSGGNSLGINSTGTSLLSFEGTLSKFNSFRLLRGSLYRTGEAVQLYSLTVFSKKMGRKILLRTVKGKDGRRFFRGNFTSGLNQSTFIGSNESSQNNQSNVSFYITPKAIKNRKFLFWNIGKKVVLEIHKGNETFEKIMNEDSTEVIDGYKVHLGKLNSTEAINFNITKEE